MEGSFADAANNHHFKRARWRRLKNQQIQDYLIAAVQNVRILLRRGRLKPAVSLSATLDTAFSSILDLSAALWRAFRPANLCWPRLAESNS